MVEIGELDLNIYGANELGMIFSKFGDIESIRILPDRECAFINYTTIEEAWRARDAVVNQMSSRLSNLHVVKVGFGKSDVLTASTPNGSTSSILPSPTSTNENVQGPTRALCNVFFIIRSSQSSS